MQSFAFAPQNGNAYAIQLIAGGRRLQGEPEPIKAVDRALAGDLVITRLSRGGEITGWMYLLGHGHGVQIGVEEVGATDFVWCETAARSDGTNGWGTKVARLPFMDGAVVRPDWSRTRVFDPAPGADRVAVCLDTVHSKVAVRVRRGNSVEFARYHAADFLAENFEPIDVVKDPSLGYLAQGFTSHGRYLYVLEGDMDSNRPDLPQGSTYVSVVDWRTGAVLRTQLIADGYGLLNREPEGMAIYTSDPTDPTSAELCIGFAVGPLGDRTATIFAKPD